MKNLDNSPKAALRDAFIGKTTEEISDLIADSIVQKNLTIEEVLQEIELLDDDHKSILAKCWIEKSQNKIADLAEILKCSLTSEAKHYLVSDFISQNSIDSNQLILLVGYLDESSMETEVRSWMRMAQRNYEDLSQVLKILKEESRDAIAQDWLKQTRRSSLDLKRALNHVKDQSEVNKIAGNWLISLDCTVNDLTEILPYTQEVEKQKILVAHMKIRRSDPEILNVITKIFRDEKVQNEMVKSWTRQKVRSSEEIINALKFIDTRKLKISALETWLDHPMSGFGGFLEISQKEIPDYLKVSLTRHLVEGKIRISNRSNLLKSILGGLKSDFSRKKVIDFLISKNSPTIDEMKIMLGSLESEKNRLNLSKNLFKKITSRDELEIIFSNLSEIENKDKIASTLARKNDDVESRYNDFVYFLNNGLICDKMNQMEVRKEFLNCRLPLDKIDDLCREIYPEVELFQVNLFLLFSRLFSDMNKDNLKSFIMRLNDDENAYNALLSVREKVTLSEEDVFEISKNRIAGKYRSISEVLNQRGLEDSLSEFGIANLRTILPGISSNTKVSDILFYFDITGKLSEFRSLIKEDVLQDISQNFSFSEDSAFVLNAELQKFRSLIPDLEIIPVEIISEYLKSKIDQKLTSIPNISNFRFGNSELIAAKFPEQSQKEDLNEEFKILYALTEENFDCLPFLTKVIDLPEEISEDNIKKLNLFFFKSKPLLLALFSLDNGLDNFSNNIGSLADGCVANIATQARISLFQCFFQESLTDQVLFSVFNEKISTKILNSGNDQLSGSALGISILNSDLINESAISPKGLLKSITEEFYKDKKIIRQAQNYIRKKLGEEMALEIIEKIISENTSFEEYNYASAQLASYLILKETVPEVLMDKGLEDFVRYNENLISSIKQEMPSNTVSEASAAAAEYEEERESNSR